MSEIRQQMKNACIIGVADENVEECWGICSTEVHVCDNMSCRMPDSD